MDRLHSLTIQQHPRIASANEILSLIERLNQEFDKTIVMVTHDARAAERAQVVMHLDKGALTT